LISREQHVAFHVPLLMPVITVCLLLGAWFSQRGGEWWGAAMSGAIGLVTGYISLESARKIRREGEQLLITNPFGTKHLNINKLALGIRVHRGSRGSTYTVYASDGGPDTDLTTTAREKGASSHRARLSALFLEGVPQAKSHTARSRIEAAEHKRKSQDAAARAYVDAYYASGKHKKIYLWVAIGVVLYVIGTMLFFSYQS